MLKRRLLIVVMVTLFALSITSFAVVPSASQAVTAPAGQFLASFRLVIDPTVYDIVCPVPGGGGCG